MPGRPGRGALRENVIVAGGGMVLLDDGQGVDGQRPEVVDAAAHAPAVATPRPLVTADRLVIRDGAATDRGVRTGLNGQAASQPAATAAALAAVAASRGVLRQGAVGQGQGGWVGVTADQETVGADGDASALAVAAAGLRAAITADSLVSGEDRVDNRRGCGLGRARLGRVVEAAAGGEAAAGAAAAAAAKGRVVGEGAVLQGERTAVVLDAAPHRRAADSDIAGAAPGHVAGERAADDGERGTAEVLDAAAQAAAGQRLTGGGRPVGAADGLVAGERAVGDGHRRAEHVHDAAAQALAGAAAGA